MSEATRRSGLSGLELAVGYDSSDAALRDFYVPCLQRATRYDRSVGYFRASALSVAARGLSRFIAGGGTVRLLVGAEVAASDVEALRGATVVPDPLAARLAEGLVTTDEVAEQRLQVLAWLVREGRLEVKVAIAVDETGEPLPVGVGEPYFHEKIGILRDAHGDAVAFQGSVNESATAWTKNFESFSVYTSWGPSAQYFDHWATRFEQRWAGEVSGFRVFELPAAVKQHLLRLAPEVEPVDRDPEEPDRPPDPGVLARVLDVAPRTVGGEEVAIATTGVTLFPHQRQVVERLAGQYPRSWLVADEVGLGKTISAGAALRRLLLDRSVERVLILAPANVCRQWQDELFEKFGLWVPRYHDGKIHGAHPDDVEPVTDGTNPYGIAPVLIASSHTARRREHQRLVEEAAPFDLLIVDEAHHARRQSFADLREYRPSRLLSLLDRLADAELVRALWMLTATPMQVHPIELRDLLCHIGLDGRLANWTDFERYYAQLALPDAKINWAWLAGALSDSAVGDQDDGSRALLDRIRGKLGPIKAAQIERFHQESDPAEVAHDLGADGRRELLEWLRHRGPVGQTVTRHSRATLKDYRDRGLLQEPIADRDVEAVTVEFQPAEAELYAQLDELIDRLMALHGTRKGAGFVLTVYRRRLTSSWAAIRKTLERRLDKEQALLLEEMDSDDVLGVGLDDPEGDELDDIVAVPFSDEDLEHVRDYLEQLESVPDSKYAQLERDLDAARGEGRSTLVFTQYVHTLDDLRERLLPAYQAQLATYTGDGGQVWRPEDGWVSIAKKDLVEAVGSGRVTVLLATDAASEGINLQACSSVINYDLPWNPMRVEQRIGRIDRIGQQRPIVRVRNYVVPGTVEERVYGALAGRIDDFTELLGNLQPILGQTEEAFRRIFRAPRAEREAAIEQELESLGQRIDDLRVGGIEFSVEDPLPVPADRRPLIDLDGLTRAVTEDLGLLLGEAGRPVTAAPERASRDEGAFAALMTYGHPQLEKELKELREAFDEPPDAPVVVDEDANTGIAAIVRADRSPAQPLRSVEELGRLDTANAGGEARQLAQQLVREASGERRERVERWLGRSEERWQRHVRAEFVRLARRAISINIVRGEREQGEPPDPVLVWHAFGQDTSSPWRYAETFRGVLGVPLDELLVVAPGELDAKASLPELGRRYVSLGRELHDLMERWRERERQG